MRGEEGKRTRRRRHPRRLEGSEGGEGLCLFIPSEVLAERLLPT